jgi:Mn-dependent DtxR family transcriptional regulator
MLGAQRPTVSITARGLQSLGLIRYARGFITVLDRLGLESAACVLQRHEGRPARAFG